MRLLSASAIALAALAVASTPATSTSPNVTFEWDGRCRGNAVAGFDCGTATLPRCHDGVCVTPTTTTKRTVDLDVLRYVTRDATAVIWWISHEDEFDFAAIQTLAAAQRASVYALQTRNAGDSRIELWSCRAEALQTSEDGSALATAVATCASELASAAIPVASVSLTSLATDAVAVIAATKAPTLPVFVYARARATLVLRRLLQLPAAQPLVAGFVFDSLRPPFVSDEDAGAARVADALLAACAADRAACGSHFGDQHPRDVLRQLYRDVDAGTSGSKCIPLVREALLAEFTDTVPSYALRGVIAKLAARNTTALLVPALLYRIHKCQDTDALTSFFHETFRRNVKVGSAHASLAAQPAPLLPERIVDFSERWPQPLPPRTTVQAELEAALMTNGSVYHQWLAYCVFANDPSSACSEVHPANPSAAALVYKRDQWATVPVGATNASVLWLASRLNAISPAVATHAMYQNVTPSGVKVAVYSDAIQQTELFGWHATMLQRVLALFMARATAAKAMAGEWHVDEVEQLLASASLPSKPLAIDGEVAIAFSAADAETTRDYFGTTYLFVESETPKSDKGGSFVQSTLIYIIVGVGIGGPLLVMSVGCLITKYATKGTGQPAPQSPRDAPAPVDLTPEQIERSRIAYEQDRARRQREEADWNRRFEQRQEREDREHLERHYALMRGEDTW